MTVLLQLMLIDHQIADQDHHLGWIAIGATDHLHAVPVHLHMLIPTLLPPAIYDHAVVHRGVAPEALRIGPDMMMVHTVPDQDHLHLEPFRQDAIATPDHLPELVVLPDLPLLELVLPRRLSGTHHLMIAAHAHPTAAGLPHRHVNATRDVLIRRHQGKLRLGILQGTIRIVQLLKNDPTLRCAGRRTFHGRLPPYHHTALRIICIQTECKGPLDVALLPMPIHVNRPIQQPQPTEIDHRRRPVPNLHFHDYRNGQALATNADTQRSIPSGPSYRNAESRPPPSAPAYQNRFTREGPPSSAPPSAPISMSAHNRSSSTTVLTAPTRPRGGYHGHGRDPPYGAPRGGRGGYPNGPPPRHSYDSRSPIDGPPSAPRGAAPYSSNHSGPPPSSHYNDHRDSAPSPHRPPFRTNNSSSTTYPRTQRFNTHAADLPRPIPGGKINNAGVDPASEKRLQELEDQKRKLLEQIDEKQAVKRKAVREWERGENEVKRDGLRTELAERSLEAMTGDGGGVVGGAF
ncbi:MAG: hypothetical protein Q9194_001222 [Teloschistes cf. exilis]